MIIIVDYVLAEECKNPDVWYTCYKCGECGRKFEDGIMVDDGGTHPRDYGNGGCGASGQWNHEEGDAIEAWNRRAET